MGKHALRKAIMVAAAGLGVAGLSACGSSDSGSSSSSSSSDPVKVAMLDAAKTTYGVRLEAAGKQQAKSMGASVDVSVADFDPQKQLEQCQTAIATGEYKAIVIYPVDNAAAAPCARQAVQAGIKFVSVETVVGPQFASDQLQIKGMTGQVWLSPQAQVGGQVELAKQACANKNPCKAAFLTGPPSYALTSAERKLWKQYTAGTNIQTVAQLAPGYDDTDAGASAARDVLQAHPDVDIMVGDDDSTFGGVVQAVKAAGKLDQVKLIGAGGTEPAVQRIKAGTQYGTAISLPETDARAAVKMAVDAARGKAPADPVLSNADISPLGKGKTVVTKANVDSFKPEY